MVRTAAAVGLALLAGMASAGEPLPDGNPDRGKRLFLQCVACHELKPGGILKVGPHLAGLFGRQAGSVPALVVSPALKASGIVWNADLLDQWLAKPTALIPGIIMVIPGIEKPQDRADLIAYMKRETGPATKAP
ncbi:MAG: c-type cytochrome [Gammaproteobacteria bacterium]|nr:c-type cytochrome [Gammaproteobacteria bacterium]